MRPLTQAAGMAQSLVVMGLAILTGCATLAPTDPYGMLPELDAPRTREPQLMDPETKSVPAPLTLPDAIAIALEQNPEVAASGYDVVAAQARSGAARGALLPSLTTEGGYVHHLDDQRLVPARYNGEPGSFSDTIFSGDLALRMPLFTGGRLINGARATELLYHASEHRLVRTREELVFSVTSVYFGILAQERLIQSLEFSREALTFHLKRVNDLIEAQKAARVDHLRTEVRLADVQQKIVREESHLAVQKQVLLSLMGIGSAASSLSLAGQLTGEATSPDSLEDAVDAAYANRPDYLAARRELEAQARRIDMARAGHYPTLNLFGAYGGRWAADAIGPDSADDVGRVGIGVEMPLYQGGRVRARVREERARLAALQQRLQKMELQIRLEVETSRLNILSARERAQTLQKTIEQAEESLRIERERYELGMGAIVDVLDAQAALLEAETNYYRTLADLNIASAQEQLATGRAE